MTLWTTQVWTLRAHVSTDFFFNMYYSSAWSCTTESSNIKLGIWRAGWKLYTDFQLGSGGLGLVGTHKPSCSKVNYNNIRRLGHFERMSSQFLIISLQQESVNYNLDTKFGPIPVSINNFFERQLSIFLLSVALFTLQKQN